MRHGGLRRGIGRSGIFRRSIGKARQREFRPPIENRLHFGMEWARHARSVAGRRRRGKCRLAINTIRLWQSTLLSVRPSRKD
jgi:hypothetical protein